MIKSHFDHVPIFFCEVVVSPNFLKRKYKFNQKDLTLLCYVNMGHDYLEANESVGKCFYLKIYKILFQIYLFASV